MIRHVVMWKLLDAGNAPRFKTLLDTCAGLVPGMLEFEVNTKAAGLEANVYVMLNSLFSDASALDAYQTHPHHKAVSAQLGPLRETRTVLDHQVISTTSPQEPKS
jgi:quinol monooxygenase YgiN